MNAAFLIMSSAALAGADPAPPPPPPAAPVVVSGAGCSNCGAPVSCCSSKPGLFDKFKSRMSGWGKKSCGCAPACPPPPCAPVCAPACPPPPKTHCCGSIADRPNLFDKLKSRWGSKKHGPCCDPCASATVITAPPSGMGTTPPKEMPKPKDEKPKGGNTSSAPAPQPVVPTVSGTSPY